MAYGTRVLPHDEWERVRHTEIGPALDTLDPEKTEILVVEEAGEILAVWSKMIVAHCECIWFADRVKANPAVGRAIWRGMAALLRKDGFRVGWTTAVTDVIDRMLRRAVPVPGRHFLLNFSRG